VKVAVEVEVDVDRVWKDVWGNDGMGFAYWVTAVRPAGEPDGAFYAWKDTSKPVDDWEPNPHDFMVYDGEGDEWHTVTIEQLVNGWVKVRNSGLTHCGGYSLDDFDGCVEDYYLQYAIFGELVFG
jgi:hypothetical protein